MTRPRAIIRALAVLCRTEWMRDDEPDDKWDWCREMAGAARDEYDRMRAEVTRLRSQRDRLREALDGLRAAAHEVTCWEWDHILPFTDDIRQDIRVLEQCEVLSMSVLAEVEKGGET